MDRSIPEIIRRMKQENPGWGAARTCGELRNLGHTCAPNTVRKYLRGFCGTAPTDRWKVFLANQREGLCSMDYFTLPAWRVRQMFVFFVIDHARRKILHINVTFFPHLEWLKQQLRAAFPGDSALPYRMLLSDNDTVFRAASDFVRNVVGLRPVFITPQSPWLNGVAERWVRTVREELTNRIIAFEERQVLRNLRDYVTYYNRHRTHSTLDGEPPEGRRGPPFPGRRLRSIPVCGGLMHRYEWKERAA